MKWMVLFLFVSMVALPSVAVGTVRHVPIQYPTIQAGIDAAVDGDTVLVAAGTYTGIGNRDVDFLAKAIVVMSESGPEATVIDCQGVPSDPHRGFRFVNREDTSSVLKGFTITNGCASNGGAIRCNRSSPTIVDNIIIENTANSGGGIHCEHAHPVIVGNTIAGNTAAEGGGGIMCASSSPTVVGNTITGNITADALSYGGGIHCYDYSLPAIEGNLFQSNSSGEAGGAIMCYWYSTASIEGNIIVENTSHNGGGVGVQWSSPIIKNNSIIGNTAQEGGGIGGCCSSSPTIEGNTIIGNMAVDNGGAIVCDWYMCPTIEGNTMVGNSATYGGAIFCYYYSSPVVRNCILWADSGSIGDEIYLDESSSISITYSDIEGGWSGMGNIDADPLFVSREKRDVRLLWGSPCIDAGRPGTVDPDGTIKDMGACYFDQSTPLTIYLTPDTTVIGRPGELGVMYTLINIEPEPGTFYLRTDVILPNGKPYPGNPVIGPQKVIVGGEKTRQRYIVHPIPGSAPLGSYIYWSRIGLPPDQLIDEDSFAFEVVEE
jgi:hypothetical protein